MKICIASQSPVKNNAVKQAFEKMFPEVPHSFECFSVSSGVGDQPMSSEETRKGALGRLEHLRSLVSDADMFVSLEGGIEEIDDTFYNHGWVVIESRDGKRGFGRTVTFSLPEGIKNLIINEGLEQSHATDRLLGRNGTKHGTGTIGPLTREAMNYTDWYFHAIICALVPFLNDELY